MYHKWPSYDVWFLRYGAWWTAFFVILDHFLHFYLPNNLKNQNFEKMKKLPGEIFLHICTINDNTMMYGPWDVEHDGQNFLSFWTIFSSLTARKIKIKKNEKYSWRYYHFNNSVPKIMIICYTVPEIWHITDVIVFFHFGLFFALYLPNSPKKSKL